MPLGFVSGPFKGSLKAVKVQGLGLEKRVQGFGLRMKVWDWWAAGFGAEGLGSWVYPTDLKRALNYRLGFV